METDAIFGCVVVALALGLLVTLALWSCRMIDRIARRGYSSVRRILRDLRNNRA